MVVVQNTKRQGVAVAASRHGGDAGEVKNTARQRGDGAGRRRWLDGQYDDTAAEEGVAGVPWRNGGGVEEDRGAVELLVVAARDEETREAAGTAMPRWTWRGRGQGLEAASCRM